MQIKIINMLTKFIQIKFSICLMKAINFTLHYENLNSASTVNSNLNISQCTQKKHFLPWMYRNTFSK